MLATGGANLCKGLLQRLLVAGRIRVGNPHAVPRQVRFGEAENLHSFAGGAFDHGERRVHVVGDSIGLRDLRCADPDRVHYAP